MKKVWMIIAMMVAVVAVAEDAVEVKEPAQLVSARTAYNNSIKAVTDPIRKKYVTQLDAMAKTLGGQGKIDEAGCVKREMEIIMGIGKDDGKEIGEPKNKKFNPSGVWISSNNKITITVSENGKWISSSEVFFGTWKIKDDNIIFISTGANAQEFSVPAKKQGTWVMNGGKTIYEMTLK